MLHGARFAEAAALALAVASLAAAGLVEVTLVPARASDLGDHWNPVAGRVWTEGATLWLDGVRPPQRRAVAFRRGLWFRRPLELTGEFYIFPRALRPADVRAAGVVFCATNRQTYYYIHFDSLYRQVIAVLHTPDANWVELGRRRNVAVASGRWQRFCVSVGRRQICVWLDGRLVLRVADDCLAGGLVGVRAGQGRVAFRRLTATGAVAEPDRPWQEGKRMLEVIQVAVSPPGRYYAFPSVARLADGRLAVVFYDGTGHVSPDGRVAIVFSADEGRTWTAPRTIIDSPMDDRDPSITQLRDGTVLVSSFRYDGRQRRVPTHTYVYRSEDGGETFDDGSPLGLGWQWDATSDEILELPDGTLLCPIYGVARPGETQRAAVVFSGDGGRTWDRDRVATVAYAADGSIHFQEPALLLLDDGTVLCELRTELLKPQHRGFYNIYETVSRDGGRTWEPARKLPLAGQASGLLLHSSGLIFHAYRKNGVSAIFRRPDEDWDPAREVPIFPVGGDAAYPSAVELRDGSILCVFYARERYMIGAVRIPPDLVERLYRHGPRALVP